MHNPLLRQVATQLFDSLVNSDIYGVWADGFYNVIAYNQTSNDDDNTYLPEEKIPYTLYKAGAKAAESLINCRKSQYANRSPS